MEQEIESTQPRRRVTLKDIADHCGVSIYPVSRVLNDKPGIHPETAARIRAAAAALGYDPLLQQAARRLAMRKGGTQPLNHVIGLILPSHMGRYRYFTEIFRGITEVFSEAAYGLLVNYTYDPLKREEINQPLPPAYARGEVDGLLLSSSLDTHFLDKLRATDYGERPAVIIGSVTDHPYSGVARDDIQGAELAMNHLLDLGHRRVLFCCKETIGFPAIVRLTGYRRACERYGVDPDVVLHPAPIIRPHSEERMEVPLQEALARVPDATAVLALNDINAVTTVYTLQRMGIRVPEEMSVIGFDDSELLPNAHGENMLTTVRYPLVDIGRDAARLMLDRISGARTARQLLTYPGTLIVRGTTVPPRQV